MTRFVHPHRTVLLAILWLLSAGLLTSALAGEEPAIGGYSPVSYFEIGRAQLGSPDYSSHYNGRLYYFTSAAQQETFEANPAAYEPLFPEHCPYNLALGRTVPIDPTNFKILDGNLLLFHYSDEMDALQAWESDERGERELLRRSKTNYTLFRF